MMHSSSLICINIVLLSGISLMSSPFIFEAREGNFFVLFFVSPLLVGSSAEVCVSGAFVSFFDGEGVDELIVPLSFSASISFAVSTFVLGAASMDAGSTDSCVLSLTYTVHQGSLRCLCRSLQNDLVLFVFLQVEQTGVFELEGKSSMTQKGRQLAVLTTKGLSTNLPFSSVHEASSVIHM